VKARVRSAREVVGRGDGRIALKPNSLTTTEEVKMGVKKAVLGAAMVAALLAAGAAFAATPHATPAGGAIRVFATPGKGNTGKIVITGAIGDFGTTINTNKAGKPNPNGNYVKIKLHQGTFMVNSVALNKKLNHLNPSFNAATCSAAAVGTGSVTLFDGTGLYAGISGKVKIAVAFAFVGPRLADGKCNPSMKAKPLAQYQSIQGTGKVSFS
jgi:hypothetical protein